MHRGGCSFSPHSLTISYIVCFTLVLQSDIYGSVTRYTRCMDTYTAAGRAYSWVDHANKRIQRKHQNGSKLYKQLCDHYTTVIIVDLECPHFVYQRVLHASRFYIHLHQLIKKRTRPYTADKGFPWCCPADAMILMHRDLGSNKSIARDSRLQGEGKSAERLHTRFNCSIATTRPGKRICLLQGHPMPPMSPYQIV